MWTFHQLQPDFNHIHNYISEEYCYISTWELWGLLQFEGLSVQQWVWVWIASCDGISTVACVEYGILIDGVEDKSCLLFYYVLARRHLFRSSVVSIVCSCLFVFLRWKRAWEYWEIVTASTTCPMYHNSDTHLFTQNPKRKIRSRSTGMQSKIVLYPIPSTQSLKNCST